MLTAITVVISISDVYNKATTVPKVLVTFLIEKLIELLIQGTSTFVARLAPQIPGVRYLTNAFLTIVVEKLLNTFFTDKLVNIITTKLTSLFYKISGTLNLKKVVQTGFKAIMA